MRPIRPAVGSHIIKTRLNRHALYQIVFRWYAISVLPLQSSSLNRLSLVLLVFPSCEPQDIHGQPRAVMFLRLHLSPKFCSLGICYLLSQHLLFTCYLSYL